MSEGEFMYFSSVKFFLTILVALCFSYIGKAQPVKNTTQFADPYLDGIIQVMLQEGSQVGITELYAEFAPMLSGFGFKSLSKRFPRSVRSEKTHNSLGERYADLTRIYTLVVGRGDTLHKAIRALRNHPMVKSAEPHFLPSPCFVPNDDSISIQYALSRINAFAAWDIQKGDTAVLIGITDTGVELDHPDLEANIYRNYADPINGLDDDGDGYIDNFLGWDTGSNDNDPSADSNYHGIHVSGLCCAVTNNQTGMAGSGFNSRFLPVKIADQQGVLSGAYEGLVYAADHGCRVINCSWGGTQFSEINQEIIRYAAVNKNCIVVCGAGNYNNEEPFYPASYSYALSVGSSDLQDAKPEFSNFGYSLDLLAPGDEVLSTWANGSYVRSGGTSMSAPVVSGAAALLCAAFPQWNSRQVAEQLKISSDRIDTLPQNKPWEHKLGAGRLNMLKALTQGGKPALVLNEIQLDCRGTGFFQPGDTVLLSGILMNYLAAANAVNLSLSSESESVRVIHSEKQVGPLPGLASYSLSGQPFVMEITSHAKINEKGLLKLQIDADGLIRDQYILFTINSDMINLETQDIKVSFRSEGSVGTPGDGFIKAHGFTYRQGGQLLAEAGFVLGISPEMVLDNIRGAEGDSVEFVTKQILQKVQTGLTNPEIYSGKFSTLISPAPIEINQRVVRSNAPEHSHFLMTEFEVINQSNSVFDNLYAGMFCDWDLDDPGKNRADWDASLQMAYVYTVPQDTLYAATQMLGDVPARVYAIDNVQGGAGGLNPGDGFSDGEKYEALRSVREKAGLASTGSDVITMNSAGPFQVLPGDTIRLAYAFHACSTKQQLLASAARAKEYYLQTVLPLSNHGADSHTDWKVYPNPTGSTFRIWTQQGSLTGVPELLDLQGRAVPAQWQRVSQGWQVSLDMPSPELLLIRIPKAQGWSYKRILVGLDKP